MAKAAKSGRTKAKAKKKSAKKASPSKSASTRKPARNPVKGKTVSASVKGAEKKGKVAAKARSTKPTTAQPKEESKTKISEALLATLAKRKEGGEKKGGTGATKGGAPGIPRPRMRRGRRPKALADYTPSHQEEADSSQEVDYQGLEYDTGITVHRRGDDLGLNFDRFDDGEEELNFDY